MGNPIGIGTEIVKDINRLMSAAANEKTLSIHSKNMGVFKVPDEIMMIYPPRIKLLTAVFILWLLIFCYSVILFHWIVFLSFIPLFVFGSRYFVRFLKVWKCYGYSRWLLIGFALIVSYLIQFPVPAVREFLVSQVYSIVGM